MSLLLRQRRVHRRSASAVTRALLWFGVETGLLFATAAELSAAGRPRLVLLHRVHKGSRGSADELDASRIGRTYAPAMATQLLASSDVLTYVSEHSRAEDEILRELREETASLPMGMAMQVSAEEGQLLALLVKLTRARTVVELGTFTGYSTLCMARALPANGLLVTCDVSDRWPAFARPYWRRAGVEDRIELRIAPALAVLDALFVEYAPGTVDLVFIDADKVGYTAYYEAALALLAPNGLIVVDNTLFFGRVADLDAQDPDTVAIREFNQHVRDDPRVEMSLVPMADGITLIRKAG